MFLSTCPLSGSRSLTNKLLQRKETVAKLRNLKVAENESQVKTLEILFYFVIFVTWLNSTRSSQWFASEVTGWRGRGEVCGGGSPGEGVKDESVDMFLHHLTWLTTDNPVVGTGEKMGAQPAFILEECNECPYQGPSLMWFSSWRDHHLTISLAGHAHLMVANLKHKATFSTLGYNQASKQQRKFLAAPKDVSYCARIASLTPKSEICFNFFASKIFIN